MITEHVVWGENTTAVPSRTPLRATTSRTSSVKSMN
jgi:hypothetical protein